MCVMSREIVCCNASLVAKASARSGEETCNWTLDPRSSSAPEKLVKIQRVPAVEMSALHVASVLQRIEIVVSVGSGGGIWYLVDRPAVVG